MNDRAIQNWYQIKLTFLVTYFQGVMMLEADREAPIKVQIIYLLYNGNNLILTKEALANFRKIINSTIYMVNHHYQLTQMKLLIIELRHIKDLFHRLSVRKNTHLVKPGKLSQSLKANKERVKARAKMICYL